MSGQSRSGGGGGMQKSGYDRSQLVARTEVLDEIVASRRNPQKAKTRRVIKRSID
jgi:hypothetical protein